MSLKHAQPIGRNPFFTTGWMFFQKGICIRSKSEGTSPVQVARVSIILTKVLDVSLGPTAGHTYLWQNKATTTTTTTTTRTRTRTITKRAR